MSGKLRTSPPRLQSQAPPNTVAVAASTRRLLGDVFVCENLGSYELKGFSEPVKAWRVTGERAVESRFDATRSGKLTQFVGRQNELSQLLSLWERAKAGEGQVALLCGEPGIGKSRLSLTFFERISGEPHITIRYQCSPHHINSPFYPVIRQIERAARFERDDTADIKLKKLEALLSLAGQTTLADAPLFAALLSIPTERTLSRAESYTPTAKEPHDRRPDPAASRSCADAAGALCLRGRALDRSDDAGADQSSDRADQEGAGTLPDHFQAGILSAMARPVECNHAPAQSTWARPSPRHHRRHRRGKELPADVYEQIISKTDGVPLFVEELTKTVLESGNAA